jgi:5-methylcytosine-specific restriction endonuclease McrA
MYYHNSTIKIKTCICEACKADPDNAKLQTPSCFFYYYDHLPEKLKEKAGTKKKVQQRNFNRRKVIAHKVRVLQKEVDGGNDQDIWYLLRRYQMKGFCSEPGCTSSTNKKSDEYYRWSVCHIVPKSLVSSVATHPDNWIELCWQHHSEFDATFDKAAAMKCFEEAKRKFNLFKYLIPNEQLRKINPNLL